jgi:hypothetical protein
VFVSTLLFIGITIDAVVAGSKTDFGFMFAFLRPNVVYDFECLFISTGSSQFSQRVSATMIPLLGFKNYSGLSLFTCTVPEIPIGGSTVFQTQILSSTFRFAISVGTPLQIAHIPLPQFSIFSVLTGGRVSVAFDTAFLPT